MATTAARPRAGRRIGAEAIALLATSAGLVALAVAQDPGRIVPETKLEVVLAPARFMARALGAWDADAGFGRLQNQAVGYLFPMGPFSWLCGALGLPAWLGQRLWIASLLVAGLWGAHRVARLVGVATATGRISAALAYTAAPATMTTVAFQSAGQIPYALAPWVLVPLVGASDRRGPRRAAAASALAVAAMGGVNGAAVLAVLPLPVIWFATRAPGPDRRRLATWWAFGVVAAVLWWAVALVVTIRYGVRFTAFTEQAATTTATESATEVWRGTGNWVPYLFVRGRPWLPGAFAMVSEPLGIVGSVGVALAGAVGLARRDAPGRAWLLPAAVLGAVAIGAGYVGDGSGLLAHQVRALLDGPLAVFRNVHKFSPVVRLPLALGLGHLVVVAERSLRVRTGRPRLVRPIIAGLAVAGIVLAVLPGADRLTAPGSFDAVPHAWRDAARWIDHQPGAPRTLLLPGSAFAEYRWGRPLDEPYGVIADDPWAVRDLIPLGGNGSTRFLDGIDTALLQDHLPVGFVPALARAGVRYLVVRNDLDLSRTGGPRPATVRRLLGGADGLRRVASFGPARRDAGGDGRLDPRPGDTGRQRVRQIDVYRVTAAVDRVTAVPAAMPVIVSGGPEAVLQIDPYRVLGRAVYVDGDAPTSARRAADRTVIATDTARRRDVQFGGIRNLVTYTLTAEQASPLTGEEPVDRWPDPEPPPRTAAEVRGAATLTDTNPHGTLVPPEGQPYAAFDDDPTSTWMPVAPYVGRALVIRFDTARRIGSITAHIPSTIGERVSAIDVVTDHGRRRATVDGQGVLRADLPPGATREVRIEVAAMVTGAATDAVGLADVRLDGVHLSRPLVTAGGVGPADTVELDRATRDRYDLTRRDEDASLDRVVTVARHRGWQVAGTASAVPGPALDRLLARLTPTADGRAIVATGTAAWQDLPAFVPAAAVDGDPGTAWVSAPLLTSPLLDLRWQGAVRIDRLRIVRVRNGPEPIRRVAIVVDGKRIVRDVPASGVVTFPAVRTDHLTLGFPRVTSATREVAVAEVEIPALGDRQAVRADDAQVRLPCGQGPELRIDGRAVPTAALTSVAALRDGGPVRWTACGAGPALAAGTHRVTAPRSGVLQVDHLALTSGEVASSEGSFDARPVTIRSWGSQARTVHLGAGGASVLATTENANAGWEATLEGRTLTPVRLDGWRQGWLVPAGRGGDVHLRYRPDATQRGGLLVGGLAVLGLVAAALVPRRRRTEPAWTMPAERPLPDGQLVAIAVITGVALGGVLVVALVPLLALPRRARRLPAVLAVLLGAMGVLAVLPALELTRSATASWAGPFAFATQVVAVVGWLALAASALSPGWGQPGPAEPADRSAHSG